MFVDVEYYELWGFITNIHKPCFRLVAYGRYAHKQGKYERQCAEAELPVMLFPYSILFYVLCQTIHYPHEADIHIRYR